MKVRSGLIQMALKGDTSMAPEEITKKMIEAHSQGLEILMIFNWITLQNGF